MTSDLRYALFSLCQQLGLIVIEPSALLSCWKQQLAINMQRTAQRLYLQNVTLVNVSDLPCVSLKYEDKCYLSQVALAPQASLPWLDLTCRALNVLAIENHLQKINGRLSTLIISNDIYCTIKCYEIFQFETLTASAWYTLQFSMIMKTNRLLKREDEIKSQIK